MKGLDFKKFFFPDDFEKINAKFFNSLLESGNLHSDLSFWYDTVSPITSIPSSALLVKYKSDYRKGLVKEKDILINCINEWDLQKYDYNEITICGSATSASLITLLFLESQKISSIFFETPTYYASIAQAESLKLNVFLLPTYMDNGFYITQTHMTYFKNHNKPKAIWLTHPRFCLGINQQEEKLVKILEMLNKNDFLIIDEATEQLFPSFTKAVHFFNFKKIIKIRSFFKGLGLNGPRLAFIEHHKDYRSEIEKHLEVTQGAIDCFSLEFAMKHLTNVSTFKTWLSESNNYVQKLCKKVQICTLGTKIVTLPIVNGSIGIVAVNLNSKKNYTKERERLIKYCAENKVAIILGAMMKFAKDIKYEYIRINYFNSEYTIIKGIETLVKFKD